MIVEGKENGSGTNRVGRGGAATHPMTTAVGGIEAAVEAERKADLRDRLQIDNQQELERLGWLK